MAFGTKEQLSRYEIIDNRLQRLKRILKLTVWSLLLWGAILGAMKRITWYFYGVVVLYVIAAIVIGAILWNIFYKFIGEYIEMERSRRKSAEILTDLTQIPMVRQVSGPQGIGKDASVTASAILIREQYLLRNEKKMKELRDKLFLIDFDRLHSYLDNVYNGQKLVVSSPKRLMEAYVVMLKNNHSFVSAVYQDHGELNGTKLLKDYVNSRPSGEFYRDGITPGGKQFLDLLFEYTLLYVRYVHVTNYVLSNQPIVEVLKLDKNQQVQEHLMSKKFKQSIIRIKEDNSFPLIASLIIIETEAAIMNGNVDKQHEMYVKHISGIREFYTLIRHILGEESIYYTITQDPYRQIKAIRELQLSYMHIMGRTDRCTSPVIRKIIDFHIMFKKIEIWLITAGIESQEWKKLRHKNLFIVIGRLLLNLLGKLIKVTKSEKMLAKVKIRGQRQISRSKSLQDRLNNRGYLEFQIGVYRSLNDVGRSVRFPGLLHGVMVEDNREQFEKKSFGFRLTCRKTDTFGRYDSHYLKIIRYEKTKKHDESFLDLPNWESMQMERGDINYMDYAPLKNIMDPLIDEKIVFADEQARKVRNLDILSTLSVKDPKKFNKMVEDAGLMQNTKVIVQEKTKRRYIPEKANWNKLEFHELLWQVCDRGLVQQLLNQLVPLKIDFSDPVRTIELILSSNLINSIDLIKMIKAQ